MGDAAPDATLIANDLSPKSLSEFRGQTVILSVVPSLDTSVCSLQTKRFNEEAAKLPNVEILTISRDLPFAQARWCGAEGVDKVTTLSDYRAGDFGKAYGLLIKEILLDARAVLVLDGDGKILHLQIVPEVTDEPDYDAAVKAARG